MGGAMPSVSRPITATCFPNVFSSCCCRCCCCRALWPSPDDCRNVAHSPHCKSGWLDGWFVSLVCVLVSMCVLWYPLKCNNNIGGKKNNNNTGAAADLTCLFVVMLLLASPAQWRWCIHGNVGGFFLFLFFLYPWAFRESLGVCVCVCLGTHLVVLHR